jgi:ATP-dependent Clp protease protease subunit
VARVNREHLSLFYEHNIELTTKTLYLGYGRSEDVDLDDKVTADIIKGLHILSTIRPEEPIRLLLNNAGGHTQHGLAVYDFILTLKSPVHVDVFGHCNSIAAWILQAADVRRMSASSQLMIHDGEGEVVGSPSSIDTWYQFGKQQDEYCRRILLDSIRAKHPGYTLGKLKKILKHDTILWAHEALELGLIDQIIPNYGEE